MAHFARIENGLVTQVIAVSNDDCKGLDGMESEEVGIAFCQNLFGGQWVQTSYNSTIRKNYAGVGYSYDQTRDAFIPPKPYASWNLNEITCRWDAPSPYPNDGLPYVWDEETVSWVAV